MRAAVGSCLLLVVLLTGCAETPVEGHLGTEALDLVEQIVYLPDGSLRERRPESAEHLETAEFLAGHVRAPWTVRFVDGDGSAYQALELHPDLEPYRSSCSEEQRDRVAGMTFRNIEFRLDNGHPGDVVILAAHWDHNRDTRDGSGRRVPGANDGASGVALLLAMQDRLAALDVPFDIVILLTDGEDGFRDCHPTAGAALYAANELRPETRHRMILLDMVGDPDARFLRETYSRQADAGLVDLLWDLAPAHGLGDNIVDRSTRILDDHVPFIAAGVPAVDIIDAGRPSTFPPYWETVDDTPDKLNATMLDDVGHWLLATLNDPRFAASWP